MTIRFRRPTGAHLDVKELEYISAIHQTDLTKVRMDGSIEDNDIRLFLMSRYGIEVTNKDVRKEIIRGLGGGNEEEDDKIDLMEVVAMLMIPTLVKASRKPKTLPKGLVKPRAGLLNYVISMILHDTTGSKAPKELTRDLIKKILISYGEIDLACENQIVEEMYEAASTPTGKLDAGAFAKALTSDVQLYNVMNETRVSTVFDDVYFTKQHKDDETWDEEEEGMSMDAALEMRKLGKELKSSQFTVSPIDRTAGTYRDKTIIVLLWTVFTLQYFAAYSSGVRYVEQDPCGDVPFAYNASWKQQSDAIKCVITAGVISWLKIFLIATLFGISFVGFGSIGNFRGCSKRWAILPLVGAFFSFLLNRITNTQVIRSAGELYLLSVALVLGILASVLHLFHFMEIFLSTDFIRSVPFLEFCTTTSCRLSETNVKQSAAFKMSEMTKNAIAIAESKEQDVVVGSYFGQGLLRFSKKGNYEEIGGFSWTWTRIFDRTLFTEDGIWLSARLLSSNAAQFLVSLFVVIAGIKLCITTNQEYGVDRAKAVTKDYTSLVFDTSVDRDLATRVVLETTVQFSTFLSDNPNYILTRSDQCSDDSLLRNMTWLGHLGCVWEGEFFRCDPDSSFDYLCSLEEAEAEDFDTMDTEELLINLAFLNASGLDVDAIINTTNTAIQEASDSSVNSLYPVKEYMIVIPFVIGTIVAFITAISLAVTYIPSATATTLKLRSGVIPTLEDPKFHQYREAADQVTILLGSLFWGCLIASVFIGGLAGCVIFLFLWQASIGIVQILVARLVGLLVVILLKVLLLQTCRTAFYTALYRKRPAEANLSSLALESANFALSVGFVFLRMIKLIVTAALYVGRIDSFFLAKGVGEIDFKNFNYKIDNYPYIFVKDILSQEAHRHPYIELLGCMYLLKLRYGEHFGNRAGSTWRLLFVYALMPWLHRYRIAARSIEHNDDDDNYHQHHADSSSRTLELQSTPKQQQDQEEEKTEETTDHRDEEQTKNGKKGGRPRVMMAVFKAWSASPLSPLLEKDSIAKPQPPSLHQDIMTDLQMRNDELEEENEYLRELLSKNGIEEHNNHIARLEFVQEV